MMKFFNLYNNRFALTGLLLMIVFSLFAQKINITGTVSDASGTLPGVNITVKGVAVGTMTDLTGKFSIQAPKDGELLVTYIGYEPQTIKINGKKTFQIILIESAKNLDEVVVVGYGTMKKRDVLGSIRSVDAKEISKSQPVNLAMALQGKVTGLDIVGSSEPGEESSYLIRGTSTLGENGSTPLFIVDGMETSNVNSINPRDIQSVEVLKDAASTAIYGSKSANGVIIITTKEGNSSKPKVSINYSLKESQIAKMLPQMNRTEGKRYEMIRNTSLKFSATINPDSLNPDYMSDNFYQELLYRKAYTHQIDASVSGAEKRLKYFLSAGYAKEDGIQINTYNNRLTTRINVDYVANDKLTLGNRFSLTVSDRRQATVSSRSSMLSRPADFNIIEPDGSYTPPLTGKPNPVAASILGPTNSKNYDLNLYEFLEYKFLPSLNFKTSITESMYQSNSSTFSPAILDRALISYSANSNSTRNSWTLDNVLTYSKNFNKVHSVTAMGGFSLQEATTDMTKLSVKGVIDGITTSNAYSAVNIGGTNTTWTGNRLASFYGRVSYNYLSRYLFNSTIRYDGSSRFGADKRWGVFPSAALGWRISDESFMGWTKPALKDAKFRLSYGVTGNQNTGDFAPLDIYATSNYADYLGLSPSRLYNPDLGWEETHQLNGGLDLLFFDGRLGLVLDYYKKQTIGVLYQVKIPQTNGISTSYLNVGSVDNNGFEFEINSTNIKTKDFVWTTSLNISFNKNIISSIPQGGQQFINNVYILDKGYPVGTLYGWKRVQIFSYDQSNAFDANWHQLTPVFDAGSKFIGYQLNGADYTGPIQQLHYSSANGPVFKGGDVMWDDVNHDGVIDANDRQVLGCGQPILMGGFNTEFRYKNFTLSAFFSFVWGGQIFNEYEYQRSNNLYSPAIRENPVTFAKSWMAPGDVAMFPSPANAAALQNTREPSNLWIEDGSYIRLKNLRIGYDIPKSFTKKLGIESMTLSAILQNFFTWSNYSGFDPEVPRSGFAVGYDNNTYPKSKDMLIGLNINF